MKKKSTWKVEAKRSGEGESPEFNAVEGSFGAMDGRPSEGVVYPWGDSLRDN